MDPTHVSFMVFFRHIRRITWKPPEPSIDYLQCILAIIVADNRRIETGEMMRFTDETMEILNSLECKIRWEIFRLAAKKYNSRNMVKFAGKKM